MRSIERRNLWIGATWLGLIVVLGVALAVVQKTAAAQAAKGAQAPIFEVDPLWPKPLPNHWLLGSTIGIWVDEQDVVWIIHRSSATLDDNERGLDRKVYECCTGAPPILAFDQAGNLVRHWGGPGEGYDWPASNHGIFVDHTGNVWIGGNGPGDSHILKFTKDGKFLLQMGKPLARQVAGANPQAKPTYRGGSNDPANFGRVAKITVDPKTNEAFIADGYLNKRVAVLDGNTGAMKRYWGAYGNKPDDADPGPYNPDAPPAQQFRNPVHCADLSKDGFLYVCDRQHDRVQVFRPDGTFVKEGFILKNTRGSGSVWDIAFSRDPQQRFLYIADGGNAKVHIVDRASLQHLTSFGDGGRQPGQFFGVHSVATDSKGNLYTTETYEGKRLQKFVYKGLGAVTRQNQGVLWPGK
jgi:DNA-binding beta-propeller fold protein YncE